MLRAIKARPILLVAAGLLWMAAVLLAAGAEVPPLSGDLAQGLGMGVGIGLEFLGVTLMVRQKRRAAEPPGAARRR